LGQVRNVALELMEKHGKEFTVDFEQNKYVVFNSRQFRNMVAGYITGNVNSKIKSEDAEKEETVANL
jgi:ribosomal protein S17E